MIGSQPATAPVPLEYCYALDAAMPVLAHSAPPIVRCNIDELADEICQRIPHVAETRMAPAALWVEPLTATWQAEMGIFARALYRGSPLVVVASRPLARLLPERCSRSGEPLGFRPGGIDQLQRALGRAGFQVEATYGLHSVLAIGLNLLSRSVERWGRPDLSDRLHFAARLHYCTTGPLAALSSVALLIAKKDVTNVQ